MNIILKLILLYYRPKSTIPNAKPTEEVTPYLFKLSILANNSTIIIPNLTNGMFLYFSLLLNTS